MRSFSQFGNDLYTGRKSFNFIGQFRKWMIISAIFLTVAALGLVVRGLNLGIEFHGGTDIRMSQISDMTNYETRAKDVVHKYLGQSAPAHVVKIKSNEIRVQTSPIDTDQRRTLEKNLATEFKTDIKNISDSLIGPSWGESVSKQALQALLWFLVLVSIVLALYFRTWKMSLAALVALLHDIFITVGIYALFNFEVTPESVIGFLTILGYSLYDTVVVFDKIRENTMEAIASERKTYSEAANLAVNQTLVRSINTSIVALLPVAVILVVGIVAIGPGTLLNLSLALFVGIAVGTYSSIFVAPPLLAWLREKEPAMRTLRRRVEKHRRNSPESHAEFVDEEAYSADEDDVIDEAAPAALVDDDGTARTATGRPLHPSVQRGPRNQPKRPPRSKR